MAGTTVPATPTGMAGSDVAALRLEFNKLVDNVDAIVLAAATNIAAVAAVTVTAAKVANNNGSTT